ncbi:MAG: alkyl/aryl-sulfatase [Bacteroidetes bacterium]|nr:MAG: alkyl/aryl-sulfatase [Bacteroidota bacterium]
MKNRVSIISIIIILVFFHGAIMFAQEKHFDPKGKTPSDFTITKWKDLKNKMPFKDERDFDEQKKGFIAEPDYREIMAEAGHVAWSMGKYDYLLEGKDFYSIHPSLQRQAILNMNYGLYEVIPGIYQVRGFDLANITFIKGKTGWIVFDPLTAKETAKAALDLINEKLGERPVVAVVISHSHADHWAGIRGVVDEKDVVSGKIKVIAPTGFMEHAVAENIYAGNAMNRRMFMQYGVLLPADPYGHVDQAIGKGVAAGTVGLLAPNVTITEHIQEMTIDGVKMIFQDTPDTEAPCEMNTYFPDMKAFWAAENITATIHNIYTLRGAMVRDALNWSKNINEALYLFGQEAEVMFASHSWPRWGNERVQEVMKDQRDTYAHLNNGVLHLVNQGVTINEIHNEYKVPKSLQNSWAARSYHGDIGNNSRGVVNRYLGHWDGNPANLIPLSPYESSALFVEMMGGAKPIITKGRELYNKGEYLHAIEILNKLAYGNPGNQEGKELLADCYEQMGYQQESTSLRNAFLAGAFELRNGIPAGASPKSSGPDLIKAMGTGLWLDFLGIRMVSEKAKDLEFSINLITPDNGEKYLIELSNSTLNNIEGFNDENADLTITINRTDLDLVMMGVKTLDKMIADGTAKTSGDVSIIEKLKSTLIHFDLRFEILPGTVPVGEQQLNRNPFQQDMPAVIGAE